MQRIVLDLGGRLDPPVSQCCQLVPVSDARDHRLEHPSAADTSLITESSLMLASSSVSSDPQDMAGLLAAQLLACATTTAVAGNWRGCGLIRPSFVPPKPLRELRELLRYRRKLVEAQAAERNQLQRLLETANIKLGSVATDVFDVSSRALCRR